MKILATYRIKSKVETLSRLHRDKLILEDPSSLLFLVKAESFMTNYMALYKNNPKAQQKLEKEKERLNEFSKMVRPLIETSIAESLKEENPEALKKTL